jgi:hypothetical protein
MFGSRVVAVSSKSVTFVFTARRASLGAGHAGRQRRRCLDRPFLRRTPGLQALVKLGAELLGECDSDRGEHGGTGGIELLSDAVVYPDSCGAVIEESPGDEIPQVA